MDSDACYCEKPTGEFCPNQTANKRTDHEGVYQIAELYHQHTMFVSLVLIMISNFLCRNDVFLVNLDDMESYEVSLNDANNY